jgi:flagellar basal-body rod protein FlgG
VLQGQAAPVEAGQIQISRFLNPAGLEPRGDNIYVETAASGVAQAGVPGIEGAGSLRQGALEGSNVSTVQELVDMIETQRAYEVNSKVISAADEMARYVTQNV